MRFVCASDTHGMHDWLFVPRGDFFILADDFTAMRELKVSESTAGRSILIQAMLEFKMAIRLRVGDHPRARKKLAYWVKLVRAAYRRDADKRIFTDDDIAKMNLARYVWAEDRYSITRALERPSQWPDELKFTIVQRARIIIRSYTIKDEIVDLCGHERLFAETESQEIRDLLANEIRAQRKRSEAENEAIYRKLLFQYWKPIGDVL